MMATEEMKSSELGMSNSAGWAKQVCHVAVFRGTMSFIVFECSF